MHIFHVITTLNKGGAESHLFSLCKGQRATGAQVTIAYLKGDGYWASPLKELGVHTIALNARGYADVSAIQRLVRAADEFLPDILHSHMPPAEVYANFAIRRANSCPYVVSKHVDLHPFAPIPPKEWLERFCARPASAVICISQAVNDYFSAKWPLDLRRKLVTVPYGLDPQEETSELRVRAAELRRQWGVDQSTVLFGIAARLVAQKSIDTLLRGFAKFRRSTGANAKLAIVGQGPLRTELEALSTELGLEDDVIWAGFHTDIPAVMRAFDVFALSSIFEGFGLVLLEAMEASTPIIASNVSAIPEIVLDKETGRLVPPKDPERLADAMAELTDPAVRAQFGAHGHIRLLEAFGVARMTERTMAVYKTVLGDG